MAQYVNLANDALALQHFDEARQIIHEAQARKLDDFGIPRRSLRSCLSRGRLRGDGGTAAVVCRQARYENFGLALASDTEAYAGHLGKARELTKRAVDSASPG